MNSMIDTEFNLRFNKPRIVMTKRGEREVRDAEATQEFWAAWRADKEALKARGYGVSKSFDGQWKVALWAQTMAAEDRKEALEASRAHDADIDIPVPTGMTLMPFQRAGIAYALKRDGTLIGDEMGLGKTVQAIGFCNAVNAKRVLVVAPASLLVNWRNEIGRWQTGGLPVHIIRPGTSFHGQTDGWYVVNYDIVGRDEYRQALHRDAWDVVILDECQYLKTRSAKRTVALLGSGKKGEDARDPVPAKRKLCLTGTPIMNRPAEMYPVLRYLDVKRWPTWTGFARRYCAGGMTRWGYNASGASNLDELNARLRETVMVRRLKADVLTELPAKRRQVVTIDVDSDAAQRAVDAENAAYDRTEAALAAANYEMQAAEASGDKAAYDGAVAKLKAAQGIAFTEMARVRHETAVAKIPAVLEHLRATEDKVLVFAHHHDVIDALVDGLAEHGVVSITGNTDNAKRQPIVERFQTDPSIRLFVGNIKAAGVGLTLTASSHVVFAELDWTPAAVSQAEDRAHRIGQRDAVLVQHLVFDGSLDGKMAKMLVDKQAIIDAALDKHVASTEADAAQPIIVPDAKQVEQKPAKPALDVNLTDEQVAAVHKALRILAAMDSDGARVINGVGFNKMDTQFGCELAARERLSPRQAAVGRKIARKYRRQYSEELLAAMG